MILTNRPQQPSLPRSLAVWRRRRAQLRRRLWEMFTAGPMTRPRARLTVFKRGAAARQHCQANLNRYCQALGVAQESSDWLAGRPEIRVTWDTMLVRYPGWPGEPAQCAILRVPKNLTKPAPAVLCFHGHTPACLIGKETTDLQAVPLTAAGYVTLAPDAIRFGERRNPRYEQADIKDWKGNGFYSERLLAMSLVLEGKCLLGAMTWEHMVAVDLLQSLPYVDRRRIGAMGSSMGGLQTFYLAAMDDRIACAVPSVAAHSFKIWAEEETLNALCCYIPGVLRDTDAGEIGGLVAPRPMLQLDGSGDMFFPEEGIRRASRWVQNIYRLYGAGDRFEQSIHASGHAYTPTDHAKMLAWFDRWLRGRG